MHEICHLSINGKPFDFKVEGAFSWGKDEVLYSPKGVISRTGWERDGFSVLPILTQAEQHELIRASTRIITGLFDTLGYVYPKDFTLDQYHLVVTTPERHQAIIAKTKFLVNDDFSIPIDVIAERISKLINRKVSTDNPMLLEAGYKSQLVTLRISRPQSMDINPPHRDGYLEYYKPILNCWLPVVGCDERSSLPVIAGSHRWNENTIYRTPAGGSKINGLPYHVPAIIRTGQGLNMIRPNPQLGEALVFTPYLIHGAAINWNPQTTRIALELRFFDTESDLI